MSESSSSASNFGASSPPMNPTLTTRARTQAFSISSEDQENSAHIFQKGDFYVNPNENFFCEERHFSCGVIQDSNQATNVDDWRMKERMKTVSAALLLCLNIGVDPPDIVKTSPCARLECWIDPFTQPPAKGFFFIFIFF